ncbi:hypothetical protein [Achromobacter denitrificans]|uniref:hypothetical protein n=1 Tax=Achromobacter denitrificans TaxID=32002 RepID=UPI001465CFB5|nr:hypothetical protein [Achromobacter denitrificans]CAB3812164.1 hypothetical protein LMG1860_00445 [Achromobacter denitrificans]
MSKPNLPPFPPLEGDDPANFFCDVVSVDAAMTYARSYAEEAVRQALAAQVPVAWRYRTNGTHINYSDVEPPSDAYDELTLCRLALIPENSHGKPT